MKTDSELQQDVSAELEWEPSVQAAHIGVEVKNGVVTLAGRVDSYFEKWNAERAAQRVSGVKARGSNGHWAESVSIAVDDDAREAYRAIRSAK